MKTLVDICISEISRNFALYNPENLVHLPVNCKQQILEWLAAHDCLCRARLALLVNNGGFAENLTQVQFFLSEQVAGIFISSKPMSLGDWN